MASGHIHDSKCPISGSDSGRLGPIPDVFEGHLRFKMLDLEVGFGASRSHPGCVRDTFAIQIARSRGSELRGFGGLEDHKIGDSCRDYVFGVIIFVIFEDKHFNLDSKIMFFVADANGDYEFCEF